MPDKIPDCWFVLAGNPPAPAALEYNAIYLHVAFLSSCSKHREFLRLNEEIDLLLPARALLHPPWSGPAEIFRQATAEPQMHHFAD